MEAQLKKYLVVIALLSAALFVASAARAGGRAADDRASKLVVGAKLMVGRNVAVPISGLAITQSEWCEERSGVRGKGVVQALLKVEGATTLSTLKAGSFYELLLTDDMSLELKFQNMSNAHDVISVTALNWKGECELPYRSITEGFQKIGVRIRNSAN